MRLCAFAQVHHRLSTSLKWLRWRLFFTRPNAPQLSGAAYSSFAARVALAPARRTLLASKPMRPERPAKTRPSRPVPEWNLQEGLHCHCLSRCGRACPVRGLHPTPRRQRSWSWRRRSGSNGGRRWTARSRNYSGLGSGAGAPGALCVRVNQATHIPHGNRHLLLPSA